MDEKEAIELIGKIGFSCKQVDEKDPPWANEYRPHWKLNFTYKGKRRTFDFWNNLENETPEKLDMLDLILGDATSGTYSLNEFFKEFGYDDIEKGLTAWKGCKSANRRIISLLKCIEDDLYDLSNAVRKLQEKKET